MKVHRLTDSQNREFCAFQYGDFDSDANNDTGDESAKGHRLILVMPGGHCDGHRYQWIGEGLEQQGFCVLVLDAPEEYRTTFFSPDKPAKTKIISAEHAAALLNHLGLDSKPYIAVGHSFGGAVILDALATAATTLPIPTACVILGTHLQAEAFGRKMPGRSDHKPLTKPADLPVLFIAGEHDTMAPPDQVRKTCARYANATYSLVQQGANHLNWAMGTGWADRPDLDGKATVNPCEQRHTTLNYLQAFAQAVSSRHKNIHQAMTEKTHNGDLFESYPPTDHLVYQDAIND